MHILCDDVVCVRACVCVCPCVCVPVLWTACDGVKGGGAKHTSIGVCARTYTRFEVVYYYFLCPRVSFMRGVCRVVVAVFQFHDKLHKSTNSSVARRSLRVGRRNVVVVH